MDWLSKLRSAIAAVIWSRQRLVAKGQKCVATLHIQPVFFMFNTQKIIHLWLFLARLVYQCENMWSIRQTQANVFSHYWIFHFVFLMFKHDFPATNMNEVISTEFSLLRVAVVDASVDKWRAKEPGVEGSKRLTVLADNILSVTFPW